MRKNKELLFDIFYRYIRHQKNKAKAGKYDYGDDVETYKMIFALAELFPVNDKYYRNEPKVELFFKELWYLYFYFKESIRVHHGETPRTKEDWKKSLNTTGIKL